MVASVEGYFTGYGGVSMELRDYIDLFSLIVFVGLVVWPIVVLRRSGKAITSADIANAIEAAKPVTQRLRLVAEDVVFGIEQIRREGQLTNNVEAFDHAFAEIRALLPAELDVSDEQIINAINRAVLLASSHTAQIDAAKNMPVIGIEADKVSVTTEGS